MEHQINNYTLVEFIPNKNNGKRRFMLTVLFLLTVPHFKTEEEAGRRDFGGE